jgi:hypothetical protein
MEPSPRGKFNPFDSGALIKSVNECKQVVQRIWSFLARFSVIDILDARGMRLAVLGIDGGTEPLEAASTCELQAFDASTTVDEVTTHKVGFYWGRINGKQPVGFAAGGVPVFTITITVSCYLYAAATFDPTNLLTTSVEIISDTDEDKPSTSTVAYQMIGSVSLVGDVLTIAASCGPFIISPCELDL